ncbi:MAG: carbamoyltransferase HypF [Thermodesulfobacteriota bacterium]
MASDERDRHVVVGRVQGVGFRPFVYRLALNHALTGHVLNSPEGVVIEVQGGRARLDGFSRDLVETLPPLAMIVKHSRENIDPVENEEAFVIKQSERGQGHHVLVSPDVATCPDCLADMADPSGRRHRYPFTNCTNCGPRYTITKSLPYDRSTTSMACFELCPECRAEYGDPLDRRFHAQPNACPACGPEVWLTDRKGKELARGDKAIRRAAKALAEGKILAAKGLGGFHLACNALDHKAVAELRRRKNRPSKPLAVMVPDLETLSLMADLGPDEAAMLAGRERPIVLVDLKPGSPLSPDVSPDTDQLGAMLPYTPLHHVLLEAVREASKGPAALVMTSGNLSSEPISLGNREALSRLASIADLFLLHNRDILVRTDDSVVRFLKTEGGQPAFQFLRRARGFTPSPVFMPVSGPSVLGVGPELKNTVCLTKGNQAFMSQHIGDMQNLETALFHKEVIAHLKRILQVEPELVVADKHPDYLSTRYALEECGLPVLRLQHHFAHIFAALAGMDVDGPVLGIALDGSGYGDDGTIWGGEFLYVDPRKLVLKRLGRFSHTRLPGGEAAIRQPWRLALSCLKELGKDPFAGNWPWLKGREQAAELVASMLDKGINSPVTSSCGRLFDAVSAVTGLTQEIQYEGQAAIRLEHARDKSETGSYSCGVLRQDGLAVLDTLELFAQAADDASRGVHPGIVSSRFHSGLAAGVSGAASTLCDEVGIKQIAISGGVFLNKIISHEILSRLIDKSYRVIMHEHEPPGDGCISIGQAYYGLIAASK